MQTPNRGLPPRAQAVGDGPCDFAREPAPASRAGDLAGRTQDERRHHRMHSGPIVGSAGAKGIDRDGDIESVGRPPGSCVTVNRKHAIRDALHREGARDFATLNHSSASHTCTPSSRCWKIEDAARPQPRSGTRIRGRRSSESASHSAGRAATTFRTRLSRMGSGRMARTAADAAAVP
jgi:hypothetical protein